MIHDANSNLSNVLGSVALSFFVMANGSSLRLPSAPLFPMTQDGQAHAGQAMNSGVTSDWLKADEADFISSNADLCAIAAMPIVQAAIITSPERNEGVEAALRGDYLGMSDFI